VKGNIADSTIRETLANVSHAQKKKKQYGKLNTFCGIKASSIEHRLV
jgi:hypothetical protein